MGVRVTRGWPGFKCSSTVINSSAGIGRWANAAIRAVLVIEMSRWPADQAGRSHRVGRRPGETAMVLIRTAQRPAVSKRVKPALMEEVRLVQPKDAEIILEVEVRATVGIVDADGRVGVLIV